MDLCLQPVIKLRREIADCQVGQAELKDPRMTDVEAVLYCQAHHWAIPNDVGINERVIDSVLYWQTRQNGSPQLTLWTNAHGTRRGFTQKEETSNFK